MQVINKDELKQDPFLLRKLKKSVFVYPTDTIYGIGCDASDRELVARVRAIKKRPDQPFSVIVPDKDMIDKYCYLGSRAEEYINKLPGPYTLIFRLKKKFVADNVNPAGGTLGIRMPDHWFSEYVKKMKCPVVTTSANVSGGNIMTSVENLSPAIKKKIDFMVNDGEIKGRPSTIVNLTGKKPEIKKR